MSIQEQSFPFNGEAVDIFAAFKDEPYPFLLESSLKHPGLGRFSFIGSDPFLVVSGDNEKCFTDLKRQFQRFALKSSKAAYPFPGGVMGYMSYDFGLAFEPAALAGAAQRGDHGGVPGCHFGFYDRVIMLDHFTRRIHVLSTGLPETGATLGLARAKERLSQAVRKLKDFHAPKAPRHISSGKNSFSDENNLLSSNFKKADYIKAVRKALEYIRLGDIYQVNLSQRFCLDAGRGGKALDPFGLYRSLRALSPSCFSGYFDVGNFQIVSSSPERFFSARKGLLETRPMKGTRPRGQGRAEDQHQEKELLASRKDIAELLMITDLERNDFGRVCRYGSVRVKELRSLEKYATVFQTTSTVTGELGAGKDLFDCLKAVFPGGSITGCPKIRAMQIIAELEPSPRSIYTGAMGYAGFGGDADFNILIRTFLVQGKKIYFHAGGGIVADSVPEDEYDETIVKAKAMKTCLNMLLAGAKR